MTQARPPAGRAERMPSTLAKKTPYFVITFVVYPIACLAAGHALSRAPGAGAPGAVRLILLWQCVLLACAVPFFASARDSTRPIHSAGATLLRACGIIAGTAAAAAALALLRAGRVPVWWIVRSSWILAGFSLLLAGVTALAVRLGAGVHGRALAGYAAAALMLGTVFYANPAVAAARGEAKLAVIQAAVAANPALCVAGSALDYDILTSRRRGASMYDLSLIGPDHLYRYPRWWVVGGGYGIIGCLMAAACSLGVRKHTRTEEKRG